MASRRIKVRCPCGVTFSVTETRFMAGHGTYHSAECRRLWPKERRADQRNLPREEPDPD